MEVTQGRSNQVEDDLGFDNAIKLGSLVETKIGHELNLVGQRMTWLVLSQSFLLVAFANVAGRRGNRDGLDLWLVHILPLLGMATCGLVWPAVRAAQTVARNLCEVRGRLEMYLNNSKEVGALPKVEDFAKYGDRKDLHLPFLGATRSDLHRSRGLKLGDLPATYLPPILAFLWLSLLAVLILSDLKWLFAITSAVPSGAALPYSGTGH